MKSVLIRLREKDSIIGVSANTLDRLCRTMGLNKTEVTHLALRKMAELWNIVEPEPWYEADDGPFTEQQWAEIKKHSLDIPDERIMNRLF